MSKGLLVNLCRLDFSQLPIRGGGLDIRGGGMDPDVQLNGQIGVK